ncbi:mechanosensitive ion channel domain-containing protein [Candidatus Methylobacter favarea]|nr:mechanosensitive ion channel domain-containing protein [Candidatus Methylobacter favarea]
MKTLAPGIVFSRTHTLLTVLLIIVLGSAGSWTATAASEKEQNPGTIETRDTVQASIEAINARQGIDEATKSKILKLYQSALDNLGKMEAFKAQAIDFKKAIQQAPEKTRKLQKEIEQSQLKLTKQNLEDFNRIPVEELEQRLIIEREKVSNLDEQIKNKESDLGLQNSRPQIIRQETLTAKQDLEAAQKKLGALVTSPGSAPETEARQIYLKTTIESRLAELKMLDVEAISNPARVELLKTELQLLDIQKNALSPVITVIENLLSERRQQEAREVQDALSQAEKAVSGKHALIQSITLENIHYSRDLQNVTDKTEQYIDQKARVEAQASEIDEDFKSAEKKISLAGLSPALGKILREQRRNLATQDQSDQQSETIQNETALTSLEQFKIEDKLKQLADVDAALQKIMKGQVDLTLPADQRMMIQAELRVLLNAQKEVLNKLSATYTTYLRILGDFDFARQQMINKAEKFAVYLDERLLWVPSSEPINSDFIAGLYHSLQWLLSPLNWMALITDMLKIAFQNLFLSLIAIVSLIIAPYCRKWAKQQLAAISDKVDKIFTDRFNYTLRALAYTLILELPLPLLVYYLGWFLNSDLRVADFTQAIGQGLQGAAAPLFMLQFFYRLFTADGIARKHFQWQKSSTCLLRKHIAWLRFIAVPAIFIITVTGASKTSIHSDYLGRLALVTLMMALAIFLSYLLKPGSGLLQGYIKVHPLAWFTRLRYVWYPVAILIPLIIIGFAIAGYYMSALELQQKLIITLRLIFLVVLIHEMVIRWLTLVNRQLALENARQKRKAMAIREKPQAGPEDPALPVEEQKIDIPKINAQTIKLLNVFIGFSVIIGFWITWKNILPAFSFLENIVLWEEVVSTDNQEITKPVTLTNLLLAGLYAFIAIVSVRNFSGIMELFVFRRWSIEPGIRYAIDQLAKYILIAIGFITVANELGGSWAKVQWLVAALSVGLGFGLQEIFANLVSGIILLFERPVRVGDVVTIGDITGKVSRIQMRATTIVDWDQKDLIVPNKTLITDKLVNWTLTSAILRIVIPVGIAYGADIESAHKVIVNAIRSTPLVLTEPETSVWFDGFGDSALNFSIFIFVELANGLAAKQNVLIRLEKALREHNIALHFVKREISFSPIVQDSGRTIQETQRIVGTPNPKQA